MKKEILFEKEEITVRQYLIRLLQIYPYDIEEALVFSLCGKDPYPHPVLLSFLHYFKDVIKLRLCTKKLTNDSALFALYQKMSRLEQRDQGVLHSYSYGFQATYRLSLHSFAHPYAHLPFQKIFFIDEILLHNHVQLTMKEYTDFPICKASSFIYRDISMDANDFLAISIQIMHRHGTIFLSKAYASYAIALTSLFHMTTTAIHQDFMLIFGLHDKIDRMEYFIDETNGLYIGLVKGNPSFFHFLHLKNMILTLYNTLCIHQHDLPIHASMLEFTYQHKHYGLLFVGESSSGKSEMLESVYCLCKDKGIVAKRIFDDHGTFHYLDNEIVTTGIEIGACRCLSFTPYEEIFQNQQQVLLLKEEHKLYQISPLLSFEETLCFRKVTHIFFLDQTLRKKELEAVLHLEDALSFFQQEKKPTLFNSCGCDQEESTLQNLVKEFITLFYVANLPIYHIYTKTNAAFKRSFYKQFACKILDEIL